MLPLSILQCGFVAKSIDVQPHIKYNLDVPTRTCTVHTHSNFCHFSCSVPYYRRSFRCLTVLIYRTTQAPSPFEFILMNVPYWALINTPRLFELIWLLFLGTEAASALGLAIRKIILVPARGLVCRLKGRTP